MTVLLPPPTGCRCRRAGCRGRRRCLSMRSKPSYLSVKRDKCGRDDVGALGEALRLCNGRRIGARGGAGSVVGALEGGDTVLFALCRARPLPLDRHAPLAYVEVADALRLRVHIRPEPRQVRHGHLPAGCHGAPPQRATELPPSPARLATCEWGRRGAHEGAAPGAPAGERTRRNARLGEASQLIYWWDKSPLDWVNNDEDQRFEQVTPSVLTHSQQRPKRARVLRGRNSQRPLESFNRFYYFGLCDMTRCNTLEMAHKLSPARRVLRQASQPDRKAASFVASLACLVLYAHVQCAFGEIVEVTVDPLREYGAEVYLEAGCYRISVDGEVHTNPGGSVSGCDEWTDAAGVCEACRYQNPWGHCFMALFASLGDDCGPDDDVLCGWMPAHSPEFEACEETTLHLRVAGEFSRAARGSTSVLLKGSNGSGRPSHSAWARTRLSLRQTASRSMRLPHVRTHAGGLAFATCEPASYCRRRLGLERQSW